MCGRVVTTSSPEDLSKYLDAREILEIPDGEDYNLAPTDRLPLVWAEVRRNDGRQRVIRVLGAARWGLVPGWADSPAIGAKMFNARAETVAEKPVFRTAYARRRCLIPVDGFYEWGVGPKGRAKEPWYIYRADGEPLVLAGLWERWFSSEPLCGELRTCTVITVQANDDLRPVHHRMPALLPPEDWSNWLNPWQTNREILDAMLRPAGNGLLERHLVDHKVNNAKNKGPKLLDELTTDSYERPSPQGRLW